MQLKLDKNQLSGNYIQFLRKAGYGYLKDKKTGQESFVRPVQGGFYPRFHIYAKETESELVLNLHLDQKKPSYKGSSAHNAEYEGFVVEQEMARLKSLI
ncbi:MAG: hypothetical protein ABIG10_02835 [bacterium]